MIRVRQINVAIDEDEKELISKCAKKLKINKENIEVKKGKKEELKLDGKSQINNYIKLEKNIGLIVIDYLQLIQGSGKKNSSREQEISEISRSLKILAKEMNVPVITLSQLSRASEQRTDHRPQLSDLRESGSIEQDADIVLMLYREDYYSDGSEEQEMEKEVDKVDIIVSKNRHGPTETVTLGWNGGSVALSSGLGATCKLSKNNNGYVKVLCHKLKVSCYLRNLLHTRLNPRAGFHELKVVNYDAVNVFHSSDFSFHFIYGDAACIIKIKVTVRESGSCSVQTKPVICVKISVSHFDTLYTRLR